MTRFSIPIFAIAMLAAPAAFTAPSSQTPRACRGSCCWRSILTDSIRPRAKAI
jgi:hypothetical protein